MKNNNLQIYLDYYTKLEAPGFAVLVTGDWGSGKTYQVLNAINKDLQCHVSLFGISDSQEVYSTVFAKMYPGKNLTKKLLDLTKDLTSEINGVTFGAGTLAGSILSPLIKHTVDRTKIIIFDDLERCSMPNKDILGVINQYIEHHQCKVIILAHDKQTHNDFIATKEKIVGHTIEVVPQIDEAAKFFFSENYKLNNFNQIKPHIINAFNKTNCKSLRILKYVINDCDRLLSCLEPVHIRNILAMKALFNFFCIVNIEHKLGNITINDIEEMPEDYLQYSIYIQQAENDNPQENDLTKKRRIFYQKYDETDLRTKIISTDLLAKIIKTGYYSKKEIIESINLSQFFIRQHKIPPWRTIINFDHMESVMVKNAISEMFEGFKHFKITDIGEMMHSFSLSYFLSDENEIGITFDELLESQIAYINELLKKELLPPESLYFDPFEDDIYERAYGFSYWTRESYSDYIDQVIAHLKKSRRKSKTNKYHSFATEILSALNNDLEHFKFLLLGNGTAPGLYSNVDVLKTITPEDFIIHWFMLPIESWNKVRMILNARYKGASFNILKNEQLWLNEVCLNLLFEARLHTGLDRTRIERLVPYPALRSF